MPPEGARDAAARTTPLERDDELDLLVDLVRGVHDGRGRVVLFEAAAGLGKTALLERGAAAAREAGLAVLRARGHELERGFAWGLARSLFEPSLSQRPRADRDRLLDGPAASARALFGEDEGEGDEGAGAPGPDAGFAITHALYWLALRLGDRAPLLVVVDDVQWVDDPSLRWPIYLSARVAEAPVGVLAAARSAEPGSADLVDVLADDPRRARQRAAPAESGGRQPARAGPVARRRRGCLPT